MYLPRQYEETRPEVMHALIAAHPLGALVMQGDDGLAADHLPFEIAPATAAAPLGVLRAHVARANPLWRLAGRPALVLFQGPQAYMPPALYDDKAINGKVVPTWNYAVVHVHGHLRVVDDRDWLLGLMTRLTDRHEQPRPAPWRVDDAPADYIDALVKAVVGIEIVIDRLEGKWKTSQNRSRDEQTRMAAGLAQEPGGAALAALMRAHLG